MDMFAPSTYEFALNRAQEPLLPHPALQPKTVSRRFASLRRWG